jgi:hypothetical protein
MDASQCRTLHVVFMLTIFLLLAVILREDLAVGCHRRLADLNCSWPDRPVVLVAPHNYIPNRLFDPL